ncbi:MAG: LLM class flavin-dependent oxidoreductase [Acidobacteria bacterium]|nr:MAG: LLM class flavin-dependent oxidoreductase [Acidobacteriota bacterium]
MREMKFGLLVNTQDPPDGARIPQLYDEIFEEAKLAEAVGFDGLFVPEHHMMPDGYLCAPLLFLAAVAAHTKRLRLGTSIMHLPEWHPIHVAEEVAVLDNISKGRVILGVGLNLNEPEFRLFGISMKGVVKRFTEEIEILRRAWSGQPFSFQGEYFQLENVMITPRVIQKPHPPIWIGAMSEPALKRAGRLGTGWVSDPLHVIHVMKAWAEIYRQSAAEHGNQDRVQVVLIRDGWVSYDERELREVWWPTVRDYHLFYKNLGFFESGRFNADWEPWVRTIRDEEWTYDRIVPDRLIAGTPAQVVDEIERYRQEVGCEYIIFYFRHPTGPDHRATMRCIELFGKEVIPHFHQ